MSNSTSDKALLDHYQQIQRIDEQVFLGLQIAGGHILLPILVLTIIFSKRISRHPVFVAFCISWIFSSITYSMIVYKDRSSNDLLSLNPSYNACLIQASLIYGVQALTSTITLSLVIHLLVLFKSFLKTKTNSPVSNLSQRWGLIYTGVLIGVPFIVFTAVTLHTLTVGSALAYNPNGQIISGSNVSTPGVFYCIILQNGDFTYSLTPGLKLLRDVYIYTASVSFSTVCLEMFIAYLVYHNRGYVNERLPREVGNWKILLVRVTSFSIYRTVSASLILAIVAHPDELFLVGIAKDNLYNGVIDFIQASIPLVAFLIFGTERDVLRIWMFWRKDSSTTRSSTGEPTVLNSENSKTKFDKSMKLEESAKRKLEDV